MAKDDDSDDTIELSSTILAGGTVTWYYDGAIDDETHKAVGTATDQYTDASGTVHTVPRYDNEADDEHDAIDEDELTISTSFAAKAVVSDEDAAAALAAATVTISGNSASRGGGIGNNGTVVSGEKSTDADTMDIAVSISKTWEADSADERPESVYVVVYYTLDGVTYSATALTLCADDDSIDNDPDTWTASFEVDGLPQGSVISVREVTVTGYLASYAGSADNGTEQNADGTYTLVLNGDAYGSYTLQSSGTDADGAYTYELLLTNTAEEDEADEAWSVQLVKYGTTSVAGNELAGATFKLYAGSMDEEGLLAQAQSADGGEDSGTDGSDDVAKGLVTWTDADGNAIDLNVGTTYYIVESDAPSGYLLADVLVVSFGEDGTPVVQLGTGEDAQTLGDADDADGGSYVVVDEDACTICIALTDAALYELPQTAGGMMWLWYVAVALAAACGVGLLGTCRPRREGMHART